MTMADCLEDYNSEDDVSPEAHNKLLDAVSKMYKKKRVDAPTRKESTLEISEFHLTQPETCKKTTKVKINDLVKTLSKKSKHDALTKKLKQTRNQTKTLLKPLEKPQAERIGRAIGYQNVKDKLNRWDPIVYQQRVAEHVAFPLKQSEIKEQKSNDFLSTFKTPTELELKMAAILNQSAVLKAKDGEDRKERDQGNEEDEFPLTLAEIVERRQMMAKVRAQQSYRQTKAARQSKIKSKKFHRIQKREKTKTELKEFEELQKKDPEAALKKLEQLEKTRAEERASLRHKSTGQWAKNLTVRAKYDKEARIALAEQLRKSKELTQKLQTNKDTSDEEEEEEINNENDEQLNDPNNPWVKKSNSEVQEFYSGYNKYWNEKNKADELKKNEQLQSNKEELNLNQIESSNLKNNSKGRTVSNEKVLGSLSNDEQIVTQQDRNPGTKQNLTENVKLKKVSKSKTNNTQMIVGKSGAWIVTPSKRTNRTNISIGKKKGNKKTSKLSIKDLMVNMDNLEQKVKKIKERNKVPVHKSDDEIEMEESDSENIPSLEMKRTNIIADVDEKLDEVAGSNSKHNNSLDNIAKLINSPNLVPTKNVTSTDDIDPNKFLTVTPKYLKSQVPNLMTAGEQLDDEEEDIEEQRHLTISEAFADDDVVDQFRKEKEHEVKKNQVENIDLSLPGWGSWGGPNVPTTTTRRKKKRFMIRFPKVNPRKDDNKSNVIINQDMDLPLKEHRVTDLPFPFTSVKDYEASIRAPIGTNWVPQSAHRKLIVPSVITKLGGIIEPMDESQLVKTV